MMTYRNKGIEIEPYAQPHKLRDLGIRPDARLRVSEATPATSLLQGAEACDQLALVYVQANDLESPARYTFADVGSTKEGYACLAALKQGTPQLAMARIVQVIGGNPDAPRKLVEQVTTAELEDIVRTVLSHEPAARRVFLSDYVDPWEGY